MAECPECGIEISKGDAVVEVDGVLVHPDCVSAPKSPRRRRLGWWASIGSRGQMGLSPVQRGDKTD